MDPAWLREWEDICQSLEALVDRLPHPQVDVIRLHYGLGGQIPRTHAEVAIQIGVSPQQVGQIEMKALMWLRQPAHSQEVRSQLAQHTQQQYELADQLAQVCLRRKGGRHERH
jgi:DNA-directed RNA polymerase sigma subunit (sigma70/sigma32)